MMHNPVRFSTPGNSSFFIRFIQYQKERFPFLQHGLLITVFTFSAVSYSHMCRMTTGFISPARLFIGVITTISFFLLLRICDEFKDHEDDKKYRPYRAVPRGLVSLRELAFLGAGVLLLQIALNGLFMPEMLLPFGIVVGYMILMTKEFFIPAWLKKHPMIYLLSHMIIMPLIDGYTTGLDWLTQGRIPPRGIEIFLIVSFFNGMVIEIGRKIRAPQAEENGVETYSALYGPVKATLLWLMCMLATFGTAVGACSFIGFAKVGVVLLLITLVSCALPGIWFIKTKQQKYAQGIETMSGIWTIGMYLIVGATPMIITVLNNILRSS